MNLPPEMCELASSYKSIIRYQEADARIQYFRISYVQCKGLELCREADPPGQGSKQALQPVGLRAGKYISERRGEMMVQLMMGRKIRSSRHRTVEIARLPVPFDRASGAH